VLTEAVRGKGYDLILAGVESEDNNASRVGAAVAEGLGLPHAFAVTGSPSGRRRERSGWWPSSAAESRRSSRLPFPPCSPSSRDRSPHYAAPQRSSGAEKCAEFHVPQGNGFEARGTGSGEATAVEVFEPPKSASAERITGTPEEIAGAILDKLKHALG